MNEGSSSFEATAIVPGKIMLAGEYAVLKGGRALAGAVDASIRLVVTSSPDADVWVESDLWSEPKRLTDSPQTEPVLDSLQQLGLSKARVSIRSEFEVAYGLGSSSAVRLGAHLATRAFYKNSVHLTLDERWDAARDAWKAQKRAQGFASGYDFVTQMQGGFVAWTPDFERWPGLVSSHPTDWLEAIVHPYVGGSGAPTSSVGGRVRSFLDAHDMWTDLLIASENLVDSFRDKSLEKLLAANAKHRSLFEVAPFYPRSLYNMLARLPDFDRSWSFKTTGAGGEDAILVLGHRSQLSLADEALRREGWKPLPFGWTRDGSRILERN